MQKVTALHEVRQTAVAMDVELPVTVTDVKGKINRYVLSGGLLAGRITKEVKVYRSNTVSISYYHLAHLNSTKCVSNEAGEVEVRYIYRAFGSQLAKIGSRKRSILITGKSWTGRTGFITSTPGIMMRKLGGLFWWARQQ